MWPYYYLDLASMFFWSLSLSGAWAFDSFEKVKMLGNSLSKDKIARGVELPHSGRKGQCKGSITKFHATEFF